MTADLLPYRLPLTSPVTLPFGTINERSGLLLRLSDGESVAWGDAAPLPGFSPETLEEARNGLEAWISSGEMPASPSARAAVEGALFELEAHEVQSESPPESGQAMPVHLAALLQGDPASILDRAARLAMEGYRAAKLKVGLRMVEEDAHLVRQVSQRLGSDVSLRLDANQAWSLEQARTFASLIRDVPIAYLEEPLRDTRLLEAFASETDLPIALDESLIHLTPSDLIRHRYARAVILKPTVLGGIATTWGWAQAAIEAGLLPVVGAAFESGVGVRHAAALALALGSTPAGLDTYRLLAADVFSTPLPLGGPTADLDALFAAEVRLTVPA